MEMVRGLQHMTAKVELREAGDEKVWFCFFCSLHLPNGTQLKEES